MDSEDREKLNTQFAEAVAADRAARERPDLPVVDMAPGVPYDQLTPEQRAARMRAARPAGWGSAEQIAMSNLMTARALRDGPR